MSKAITKYTNSNIGIGITGKFIRIDINNPYGDNNIVYISIYDKDINKMYNSEIKVDKETRKENKELVINEIINMLKNII